MQVQMGLKANWHISGPEYQILVIFLNKERYFLKAYRQADSTDTYQKNCPAMLFIMMETLAWNNDHLAYILVYL
jgi:hypothetical protein